MIHDFSHCQHETERKVFDFLEQALPKTTDIIVYPNIELYDRSRALYVECDAIVVTRSFIAVVELKDWFGEIMVGEPKWRRGSNFVDSPHVVNNRKCKVFKSYIQHVLSGVPEHKLPFVQSVVALTNQKANVDGASSAGQANLNGGLITLDGIDELAQYLKRRLHSREELDRVLTDSQLHRLIDQLNKDKQAVSVSYEDQIPGYRIREDRGSAPNYITYVAERNPNFDNRLYRLRVFGELSKDAATAEIQIRSLKAAAALPHHPCIRPVAAHPNDRKLIVEVSDWTDTHSLDDLLAEQGRLDWRRAAAVVSDIAQALDCVHESTASLIHRNVQPRSILLGADGHAQLTDFDLAFDPGADLSVLGANYEDHLFAAFTAPELLLGRTDFKSDVYSLGAVFFRALVGKNIGSKVDLEHELEQALQDSAGGEEQHARLCELVQGMLASDPSERPNARDVVATVAVLLNTIPDKRHDVLEEMPDSPAYTSRALLAEGATAQVFQVDNHGELFIHKIFKAHVARDQALQERDILRLVDRLDLPVLFPRVRHFSEVAGHRWCLATDLVPGKSICELIRAGTRPSMHQFLSVARVLLSALATLHATRRQDTQAVIHNDLTPHNVFVDMQSNAVGIIDFGCASGTGVVSLRGTPGYVHPALVSRGDMNACPQGDLYAIGKTLSQWLLGNSELSEKAPEFYRNEEAQNARVLAWLEGATTAEGDCYADADAMLAKLDAALGVPEPHAPSLIEARGEASEESVAAPTLQVDAPKRPEPDANSSYLDNPFVDYLNTLHNIGAGNANALAEYQATNKYFPTIYEPTQLAADIYQRLTSGKEVVIVLSGHAGDGKSTVALEVLKQLRRMTSEETLSSPPKPYEVENIDGLRVSILKDMSEHTADERLAKFKEASVAGSGSWLIVSNTGPLLNTLSRMRNANEEIEQEVLNLLDRPIVGTLNDSAHCISNFEKPIYIANLSKLDNVETAVNVLTKISNHSSWQECDACCLQSVCPIRKNVCAIQQAPQLKQRVSSMYRLLTAYERRLTMRQMTAHLAYSITGGAGCAEVADKIDQHGVDPTLRQHLFSELFFGFSDRQRSLQTSSLYCVEQLNAHVTSERTRPAVELKLQHEPLNSFAPVPEVVHPPLLYWQSKSADGIHGGTARSAIRRLAFMFGTRLDSRWWESFTQDFSGSPVLEAWEKWHVSGFQHTSISERRALVRQILSVLSEHCIGAVRTASIKDKLYITLRRDDMETTQPVQVVIGEYDENDFRMEFNDSEKMPRLVYSPANGAVFMKLPLPLLDFVSHRSTGDFGQDLDPIHINQLDLFCSQLVACKRLPEDDLRLLSISITGEQNVYRVAIDKSTMEIY
ncbi:protein kinase domain-containing protein [Pigmentiphaga litoralis]|uniref:non-specific serine/threonine protein kinase n=1 Tax=Pigmentiphaga litoralis TaxID=516702 RepID=A0A7Y9IR45_9BURK|nr:serine/threonine protein kinase [Pigmentiphaga litoralis]NYE80779.1 serine/threonine protein kinase [Pigmentiphaga litoralis]